MAGPRAFDAHSTRAGHAQPQPPKRRALLELSLGYALIVATLWTPRPLQGWLYWASILFIAATTWTSFPGCAALGLRKGGFASSAWVIALAALFALAAHGLALHLHTLRQPHGLRGWLIAFGGYALWSCVQQFLLQGYFLFRLLHILPRREWAAIAAAVLFAAAHIPNPILMPLTLGWGLCACFVFLRFRNLYPLAIAHAILGITVAITIPGPVIHNMRVGRGYLRYHAPRAPVITPPRIDRWSSEPNAGMR